MILVITTVLSLALSLTMAVVTWHVLETSPFLGRPRRRLEVAVGGLALAGATGALGWTLVLSGAPTLIGIAQAARVSVASQGPLQPPPLELLVLGHERGDGQLTVQGVVRNPTEGIEMTRLTAVVLLFNQQGGFLTSGRAPVDAPALEPGSNAAFAVTVPSTGDVGRYRVSFRTEDRVVPHVDRRS